MGDAEFRNVVALTDGMVRVEDGFYVNEETGDSLEYVTKGTRIMDTVCAQDGWYKMRDGVVSGPLEVWYDAPVPTRQDVREAMEQYGVVLP